MEYKKILFTVKLLTFSFIVYFILPLVIAFFSHVLYKEDVAKKMPANFKRDYEKNEKRILENKNSILSTQDKIILDSTNNVTDKIAKIEYLEKENIRRVMLFRVAGISYNRLAFIYPLSIFLLLFIYFILLTNKNNYSIFQHIKIILPVYVFQASFMWYRNSPLGQSGRTVFSAYNIDINPLMYFFQEFCLISFYTLIVMIWHKIFSEMEQKKNFSINHNSIDEILKFISNTKAKYKKWQIMSILLFLTFGFYSYHFWHSVYKSNDTRYMYQAFSFNIFWILTWFICSIPTFKQIKYWDNIKIKILLSEEIEGRNYSLNNLQKYLSENQLVSNLNQLVSTIIMILSFLIPILKAILE